LVGGGLALSLLIPAHADEERHLGTYHFITTVKVPGDLAGGFDISWVDSDRGRYYLTDRGTTSIDVINTRKNAFVTAIPLHAAGNGVVAIRSSADDDEWDDGADELWVGDAKSFVEVINLKTKAIVADIPTNGTARADELAFDPRDHIVVIANDRDPIPFLSFISTTTRSVLGTLPFPEVVFGTPAVGHGLEQTVWNPKTRRFYLAVPATSTHHLGEVDEINPHTRMVTRVFPTTCSPAGLALVPGQRLVTSCGDILSVATGTVLKTVGGVGGDEIWFNRGDERVYFGGGLNRISVPVLDTDTSTLVTTLTVGTLFTPPTPSHTTHSVAADAHHLRVFVPVTHEGVKVYSDAASDDDNH
jgi:hypothetical protein